MTAPKLEKMKFWIVKPKAAINQIHNPTFAHPEFEEDWTAIGAGVTIAETGDEQRWGAYSMKVNPANNTSSGAYHGGLTVANTLAYTFSCYVKGVAGQAMRILISDGADAVKATKQFTATGYWQRVEVTHTAAENATTYRAKVLRDAVASTAVYYVDGCQFEQDSKASTFFDGYSPGCRWTGALRNSPSERSGVTGLGGELLCINDYARVISVQGFGNGQWNQILTKMTSGGDLYQTHTRKSRNISMVVTYEGNNQGDMQANRKVLLDALRPDLLSNVSPVEQFGINMPSLYRGHEQRILRYQGFDADGNEATNPVDIICVFQPSLNDTPQTPVFQKDVLNFIVPSGLFQGAYNEGTFLDWEAEFPADYTVKRDLNGNWCRWNGTAYESIADFHAYSADTTKRIVELQDGTLVGPDYPIPYMGGDYKFLFHVCPPGGTTSQVYCTITNPWVPPEYIGMDKAIGAGYGDSFYAVIDMNMIGAHDPSGARRRLCVITKNPSGDDWSATSLEAGGSGTAVAVGPDFTVYVASGTSVRYLPAGSATWETTPSFNNGEIRALAISPDNVLYAGGSFTAQGADFYYGVAKWDGTNWNPVSSPGAGQGGLGDPKVNALLFTQTGSLIAGGYIYFGVSVWNGTQWERLGDGVDGEVYDIKPYGNGYIVCGDFARVGVWYGNTAPGVKADRVAEFVGNQWRPLNIQLPAGAVKTALVNNKGELYLTGEFSTTVSGTNVKCGIVSDKIYSIGVASASANTYPVISITGPGTLKAITNYSTGKSVMFDGLTLGDGEWVSFNFDPLQLSFRSGWTGRGNLMRYVIPGSDYGDFYLRAGSNSLSLYMTDTDDDKSSAAIVWTPKFWGLDGALL